MLIGSGTRSASTLRTGLRRALGAAERHPGRSLTLMVLLATVGWYLAARQQVAPWIFGDEYLYVESARSLATEGAMRARGIPIYYSLITPLLDAPGFLLGDMNFAYGWIKVANALVMSLSALPAYGLARMALSRRASLAAAALVLAWPAFGYAGTVMTEPAFMPAMLGACWALARALDCPTLRRQAVTGLLVIVAFLVRVQAVVLVAVVIVGVLAHALLGRADDAGPLRRLRPHAPLLAFSTILPIAGAVIQQIRTGSAEQALGSYSGLRLSQFSLSQTGLWSERNLAVVALSVLVAPCAIAIGTWAWSLTRRHAGTPADAMLIATASFCLLLFLQVTLFSTFALFGSDRVHERNLFTLEPLLLIVALAGLSRRTLLRPVAVIAAVGSLLAVLAFPVQQFLVQTVPYADTFTLLAYGDWAGRLGVGVVTLIRTVAIVGALGTAALVVARRRPALLAVLPTMGAGLVLASVGVSSTLAAYSRVNAFGTAPTPREWVDDAVGPNARVAFVWPSELPPALAWQTEIWNRSITSVMSVPNPLPVLPGPQAEIDPATGRFRMLSGQMVTERLAVLWGRWRAVGTPIAQTTGGGVRLRLWRLDGPLRLSLTSDGVYGDGWSGPTVQARSFACRGGVFDVPVAVGWGPLKRLRVRASGEPARTILIRGTATRTLHLSAAPNAAGTCTLEIDVSPTAVANTLAHNGDPRVIGMHVGRIGFRPGRP